MDIKAIALDMDGTLLNPIGLIDEKLIHQLEKLQQRGIKIFIATGRTQKEIVDVLPSHVNMDGYVSANGMGAYTKEKKLSQHSLDETLLQKVISEAREENIYYEVHPLKGPRLALTEDKPYFVAELEKYIPETLLENELNSRKKAIREHINWVNKLKYEHIVKVYFFSVDTEKINTWKKHLENLKKEITFTTSCSSLHNVEMMVSGVSKGTGIKLLLEESGINKENLLVVGDGENDLPMFELAGHAVAMKNAEKNVQAQADTVTDFGYEQNGLYHYLKQKFSL
ncbi:HAD family hydrolase [Oceanobacillus caeni]|uniref:HAD family hydrolase n=1 Tax=Oceanobacillus caeni TaxID=405946 RepID=UPI001C22177C|nr:HAD family hydrolase [Oceanobacillus caeni]MBU8790538.1 HAD family hydrolase [Oceanobacillus caeni]